MYLKLTTLCLILLCGITTEAQFNASSEINNSIDFLYEISNSTCDPDMEMVAGIRIGVNGNFNTDQLVFGKLDLVTGNLNTLTTYPSNLGSHFNALENVEMTASTNILNNNDGHVMVFSAQDAPGAEFNLHVVKVDCNGNPFWSLNPYDANGFSEYSTEIFQDSNGDFILAGYREGGGLTREPLVLKIDRNGNVIETKVLHVDQDGDGVDDFAFATDIIEVTGTSTNAKYVISGAAANDAFIITLDNIFDPLDHAFYDIDNNPASGERISQIVKIGGAFWATGVGNLGATGGRYTFALNVNALSAFVPILNLNWARKYQLNSFANYPGDLVVNAAGSGVVIAGTLVSTSTAINFPTKGYMIEVVGGGAINFAWEQNKSSEFGALLELEKRGNEYLACGYFSGSGSTPASGLKFLKTDINGDTGGCQETLVAVDIVTSTSLTTQSVMSEDFNRSEAFWGFTFGNVTHTQLDCDEAGNAFMINVFKYEDRNCDGIYTPGIDIPLPNWSIEIRNNTNFLVANGTTNGLGQFSASLPAGTYTVSEILNTPWLASSANAPSQSVIVDASNPVVQVDFGNKNPKSCTCIDQRITDNGNCCYEVIIDNNFGPYYDEIRVSLIGVGSLVNAVPNAGWNMAQTGNILIYTHNSGLIPTGNAINLGLFCTKGVFGTAQIKIQWLKNGDLQCETDLNIDCPCPEEPSYTLFDKNIKVQNDLTVETFDMATDVIQDPMGNYVYAGIQYIDVIDPSGVLVNKPLPYLMKTDPNGNIILGPVFIDLIGNEMNQNTLKVQIENHRYANTWTGYSIAIDGIKNGNEYIHLTYLDPTFKKICERPIYLSGSDLRLEDYLLQGNDIFMVGQEDQTNNNLLLLKIPGQTDCLNDFYQIASYPGLEKGVSIATSGLTTPLFITGKKGNSSYVVKIDQNLNLLNFPTGNNTKLFDLNNNSNEPIDIGSIGSGNFIIAGNMTHNATNDQEYFILEHNENGNFIGYNFSRYDTPEDNMKMTEMKVDPVNASVAIVGTKDDQTTTITTDRLSHSMVLTSLFDEIGHANYVFGSGYQETRSQAFDFASDGGLILAHAIVNDPCSGFCLDEYDSKITKTGMLGYLDDCECYYPSCSERIKEIDIFSEVNEIGIILGAIFAKDSIGCKDIMYDETICRGGMGSVCMISTTSNITNTDSCCIVSLDLSNNNPTTSPVHKIQIDLLGPSGLFFDFVNSNGALGFQIDPSATTQTRIVLQNNPLASTPLPTGSSIDYVNFCYGNSTSGNLPNQQLKISYFDASCNLITDCMDTLNTTCIAIPLDDDCYEVNTISIDCDSLPNLFLYCFDVTNYNPTKTLKWIEFNNTSSVIMTPASPYCLTSPVAPLSTGSQECVYLYDYSGLPLPRPIKLYPAMHDIDSTFCCNDLDSLCLVLPNCCDPCDTTWVMLDTTSMMLDSCCFTLDIYNDCDFTLTKIITESLTPGVNLGSVYLGGPNAGQWTLQNYTGNRVEWHPISSSAPKGFSDDLINFCLDDTLGTLNQDVAIHYVMQNSLGLDSIACSDTLRFHCSSDIKCLELVRDSVYCDMNGDYFVDVKLMNVSSPSFIADRIDVNYSSLQSLFPIPTTFNVTPFGPGAMTTLTMQIRGIPNALPGQQIDLSFMMHDNLTPPLDTCCWESVDLTIILPPCDDCCDDFQAFCNDITFQSNIYGFCDTGYVDIMFADTCTYADIDWGDGTTESRQGAFSAQHLYSTPGQYVVCADFKESSDGGLTFCWNKLICDTLNISMCPPSNSALLCDSIMWDTLSVLGWAAATCYSEGIPNAPVLGLMDFRKHQDAPLGSNWGATSVPTPLTKIYGKGGTQWDANTLGEVFGLAVDQYGNIFVASFGMYEHTFTNPNWGIAGRPAIYKVNAITGAVTIVNDNLPQQVDPIFNQYPGFGNIAYNFKNNLIYVANMEDGKIYTLDPNGYNSVIDVFDFNLPDNGVAGFAPLGEAIMGIGYNHVEDAIYFGDWINDESAVNGLANSIYKVNLNPTDGKFVGSATLQFTVPMVNTAWNLGNPAGDISFDHSGKKMLISEKGFASYTSTAHLARTLEYYKFSGTWIAEPTYKYQSFEFTRSNATGGNDYTYGDSLLMVCDTIALMMEDAIHFGFPNLYGIRGVKTTGGNVGNSIIADLDGNVTNVDKYILGDVEVFRNLCCGSEMLSICDTIDWSGFDIALASNCVSGIFPDVTITTSTGSTTPDWVDYDYDCNNSIDQTNTGSPYLGVIVQNITSPSFSVCATAYKVINGDTCMITVMKSIVLPPCPTTMPDCCDSLAIYGDFDDNLPDQIKVYGGFTYIASRILNIGSTNVRPVFSKFDANNNLVWEIQIDDIGRLFDFVQTDDGGFLLVGRSEPARTGSTDFDNHSILAKVDANGSLVFAQALLNAGREGFLKIVKPNFPVDPAFPYYIGAIENYDGFSSPATAFDEFHLYNINDLGVIKFNAEYKYRTNTNTPTNDDQWQGLVALNNGDILILGDYDPGFNGTFVIASGFDGSLRGVERQSSNKMRFYDAVESANGNLILVGRYQDGSNDAAIVLLDGTFNYLNSLRYSGGVITEFREIHASSNSNEFFTIGQGQNGIPIIIKFEIDASNQIVELESKYWIDGETDFSSPRIFTSPSHNRLAYTDARKGNAKSFGNYDVIYGSFSKLLDEDCLKDTILSSAPDAFVFNASSATMLNKPDPLIAQLLDVNPNLDFDFLCFEVVQDCDSIDWSPFDIVLVKDCNNIDPVTGYPQVDIIPSFGSLPLYKIDYDVADDGFVELSDMTFGPILHPSFTNPNLYLSATAYIILPNGDTCTHKVIRDLFVEPCPAFCCISQSEFDNDVGSVSFATLENGAIEVRYPDLNGCHEVSINWGDDEESMMMGSSMMTMHMYASSGAYDVEINVREIGDDGNACFETTITQMITNTINLSAPIDFNVFPNPFEDNIIIEFSGTLEKVEIYDLHGRSIIQKSVETGTKETRISLGDLIDGIYIVRVYGENGREGIKRVIKM